MIYPLEYMHPENIKNKINEIINKLNELQKYNDWKYENERLTQKLNELDSLIIESQDCGLKQYALDLQSENKTLRTQLKRAIEIAEGYFACSISGDCNCHDCNRYVELQKMKEVL